MVTNALPGAGVGKGPCDLGCPGVGAGAACPPAAPLTPRPTPPQLVSRGCETRELALPRDGQGRLGFEVDAAGFITHVERFTFAETTGLRPGARLLRVCGQTLPSLGPEAAAQLLRSAPKVCVTVLPPDDSGRPRRSGRRDAGRWEDRAAWPPGRLCCVPLATGTLRGGFSLREPHVPHLISLNGTFLMGRRKPIKHCLHCGERSKCSPP